MATPNLTEKINYTLNASASPNPMRSKINNALSVEERTEYNPFLDSNGNLRYKIPQTVYQGMLDNGTNAKVKEFVSQATGLSPTSKVQPNNSFASTQTASESYSGNVSVSSSDGVFKNTELLGIINRVSKETGVPANILLAVAQQETGGKWYDSVPDGKGHSYGYMMLYDYGALSALSQEMKQKAKTDPYTNVLVGAQVLASNYNKYGNWQTAAARYNGSGSAAEKYGSTVWSRANSQAYMDAANQLSASGISSSNSIVNTANRYIGTPYVWGGTSPKGFDCSGFVQYVYAQNGISIPRNTTAQYKSGATISQDSLQPGDLVFFKGEGGSAAAPGHVGIYIGNGQYIHSPKTGDTVKVSNMSGRRDYVGARRYR